jgi:hypothetical protein
MNETETAPFSRFNTPQQSLGRTDCFFRANHEASPAAMAQFGKSQGVVFQDGNGVELAQILALAAKSAFVFINLRNLQIDLFPAVYFGFQKEVSVGFLHVAIQ